jgi:hypothetical protein
MLFILNHAFSTIRAGYCPQGRYLTPVAWALLLLALVYYRESGNAFFKKAFLVLPLYSLFVALYQSVQPSTLYQPTTHDSLLRQGLLFQNLSNSRIHLPGLLPSFIKADNRGYLPNFIFLGIFLLLVGFSLLRRRRRGGGVIASLLLFFSIFSLACLFPRPSLANPQALSGPRNLPCRVYFTPAPATGGEKAAWFFSGEGRSRMLIETLVPLKSIEIRIQNLSGTAPLELAIDHFDEKAARLRLPENATGRVVLNQPHFEKIKARHYYQFLLAASAGKGKARASWLLQINLR